MGMNATWHAPGAHGAVTTCSGVAALSQRPLPAPGEARQRLLCFYEVGRPRRIAFVPRCPQNLDLGLGLLVYVSAWVLPLHS